MAWRFSKLVRTTDALGASGQAQWRETSFASGIELLQTFVQRRRSRMTSAIASEASIGPVESASTWKLQNSYLNPAPADAVVVKSRQAIGKFAAGPGACRRLDDRSSGRVFSGAYPRMARPDPDDSRSENVERLWVTADVEIGDDPEQRHRKTVKVIIFCNDP